MLKKTVVLSFILLSVSLSLLAQTLQTHTLTLHEAILLSLRNNPTVQSAELDRVVQKYELFVQQKEFRPKYSLDASFDHTSSTIDGNHSHLNQINVTPTISLATHYGTNLSLTSDNPKTMPGYYTPALTLEVRQHLIRGFSKTVVDAALNNALDNEEINKLSFKNTLISIINTVISDYLSLIQMKETLKIDQTSLKAYERTIKNDKAMIAAGRMAESNLIQTKAQLATQKAIIQNDLNNMTQMRLKLMNTIGLDPNAKIQIPDKIDFDVIIKQILGNKKIPNIETSKQLALKNNVSYQQEGIGLKTLERALFVAKDNTRWALDLTARKTVNSGNDKNTSGLNNLFNGDNQSQGVNLELSIPIDDVQSKQALLNAKIGLDQAMIAYRDSARQLQLNVINYRNTLLSNKTQLDLSKQALDFQRRTVEITRLKQQAGQVSTFELLNNQKDLTVSEQNVITTMIGYINNLALFDQILGTTLEHWGIEIKD